MMDNNKIKTETETKIKVIGILGTKEEEKIKFEKKNK